MNLSPLRRSFLFEIIVVVYCATIVYATLYPWSGWRAPLGGSPFRYLSEPWPRFWTRFDVVSNFVAYVPLGALVAIRIRSSRRGIVILLTALACGGALSLALESLQSFLPTRVPSILDLTVNAAGAAAGALAAVLFLPRPEAAKQIQWHRPAALHPESSIVIALTLLWLLAQLTPHRMLFETGSWLSPVMSFLQRRAGAAGGFDTTGDIAGALATLLSTMQVSTVYATVIEAAVVSASVTALGLMLTDALASTPARLVVISMVLTVGVLLRGLISGLATGGVEFGFWLSRGAQIGLLAGPLLLIVLSGSRRRIRLIWTLALLLLGLLLANLMPDNPYQRQMMAAATRQDSLRSLISLLRAIAIAWPFIALAVVGRQLYLHYQRWEGLPFIRESALARDRIA